MHDFSINSHKGPYSVEFKSITNELIRSLGTHFIVDSNVEQHVGELRNRQLITATEEAKNFTNIGPIITSLMAMNLRRDSVLVAVGGGITQDIACFIASNFMRGIKWVFVPTTLLAQADSCIGSKASINFHQYKNLLGSFNAPNRVIISHEVLSTLDPKDIKSGIGEIIKLYLLNGQLIEPQEILDNLKASIYQALLIKKPYVEQDEFDLSIRNILNYGHCFGHAIESATDFAIPHGIAICMGMDIANRFSLLEDKITLDQFNKIHRVLFSNYSEFSNIPMELLKIFDALTKDKKNTGSKINLILPVNESFAKFGYDNTAKFWDLVLRAVLSTPITVLS